MSLIQVAPFGYADAFGLSSAQLDASFGGLAAGSIAALRQLSRWAPAPAVQALGTPAGFCIVLGTDTPGDAGGVRIFYWDPTGSGGDDGATIINPVDPDGDANEGFGRWLLANPALAPPAVIAAPHYDFSNPDYSGFLLSGPGVL